MKKVFCEGCEHFRIFHGVDYCKTHLRKFEDYYSKHETEYKCEIRNKHNDCRYFKTKSKPIPITPDTWFDYIWRKIHEKI